MLEPKEKELLREIAEEEIRRTKQVMYDLGIEGKDKKSKEYVEQLQNIALKL